MKDWFRSVTRSVRWKLIRILSPSTWDKSQKSTCPQSVIPRGSTLNAIRHFGNKPITVCEIGVNKAENTVNIMGLLNITHAYLIDFYEEYTYFFQDKSYRISQEEQKKAFGEAQRNLEPFRDRITWILKSSDKAVNDLPENVDFIYIDGNHAYESVKRDMELYWQKVADKGILAGHDFFGTYNGVIKAVHEFAMKHGLQISSDLYDWWFIKT